MKTKNSARSPRILHADDEPMICLSVGRALRQLGYIVMSVNDGEKAWEALNTECFDLLITDNEMPNLRGEELVLKIREHELDLPIIVASSQLEFFLTPDNEGLQIAQVLKKPFSLHELVAAVQFALQDRGKLNCSQ